MITVSSNNGCQEFVWIDEVLGLDTNSIEVIFKEIEPKQWEELICHDDF